MLATAKAAWCRILIDSNHPGQVDSDEEEEEEEEQVRLVGLLKGLARQSWPASNPNRHHLLHLDFVQPVELEDEEEDLSLIQAWRKPVARLKILGKEEETDLERMNENDLERPFCLQVGMTEGEVASLIHRLAVAIHSHLTIQLHTTLLNEVKPVSPLGWDGRQPADFQRNLHLRHPARRAKLRGDLLVQLGAYSEAISVLAPAVDDCRQQGDLLWMAAAQEALHTALGLQAEREALRAMSAGPHLEQKPAPVETPVTNAPLSLLNEQHLSEDEAGDEAEQAAAEIEASVVASPPALSMGSSSPPPPPTSLACSLCAEKLTQVATVYSQQQMQGLAAECWWLAGLLAWAAGKAAEAVQAITMAYHQIMLPRQQSKEGLAMVRVRFTGRCLLLYAGWGMARKALLMHRQLAQQLRTQGLLSEAALLLGRALRLPTVPLAMRSLLLEEALNVAMARQDRHYAIQLAWERVACLTGDTAPAEQGRLWASLRRLTMASSSLSAFQGNLGLVSALVIDLVKLRREGKADNSTFLYAPRSSSAAADGGGELWVAVQGEAMRISLQMENRLAFDLPLANVRLLFEEGQQVECEVIPSLRLNRRKGPQSTKVEVEFYATVVGGEQARPTALEFECLGTRITHPLAPAPSAFPVIRPQPLLRLQASSWSEPWLEWWEGEQGGAWVRLENVTGILISTLQLAGEHSFQLEERRGPERGESGEGGEGILLSLRFNAPRVSGNQVLLIEYGGNAATGLRQLTIPLVITLRPLLLLQDWTVLPFNDEHCLLVMDWQGPDNLPLELAFSLGSVSLSQHPLNGLGRIALRLPRQASLDAFTILGQWRLGDRRGVIRPPLEYLVEDYGELLRLPPVKIWIESPRRVNLGEQFSVCVMVDTQLTSWEVECRVCSLEEPFDEAYTVTRGPLTGENCNRLGFELVGKLMGMLQIEARVLGGEGDELWWADTIFVTVN